MAWVNPTRSLTGVQFENIRTKIDDKFNDCHDRLSAAYYDGGIFTQSGYTWDFGVLKTNNAVDAKILFDKLHGLIFFIRDIVFNETNLGLPKNQQYPQSAYNELRDESGNLITTKTTLAQTVINLLKAEGIELVI